MMRTAIPVINTAIVLFEQPFHSLRMIPQTLEKVTLSAIRIQNARVSIALPASKKLLPRLRPKNWLYQRRPARAQKMRFDPQMLVSL